MREWILALHNRLLSISTLLILLSVASLGYAAPQDFHRLVVKFKSAPSAKLSFLKTNLAAVAVSPVFSAGQRSTSNEGWREKYYVVTFTDSVTLKQAMTSLSQDDDIESVEPDFLMELFYDPLFDRQWGMANSGQEYYGIIRRSGLENDTLALLTGLPGADIGWDEAQGAAVDHSRVIVAIIDTGVDYYHPDIAANIWRNESERFGQEGKDDDLNGYVDDAVGFDFSGDIVTGFSFSPDSDPVDTIGHGSHVAGIVGAAADNDIGIKGVAPNVEIMCLKIFPNAFASVSAQAIVYSVDHGARVINASWGSPYYSSILADAVEYAVSRGVLFVVAAGNSGASTPFYPAALDRSLTVGASDAHDQITRFSTFGDWLDLAAPGQDILSLRAARTDLYGTQGEPLVHIIAQDYYLADGTSMAAPHVSGAAAFLLSVAPHLSGDSVRALLIAGADQIRDPSGQSQGAFSAFSGWGRINLARSVALLSSHYAEIESPHPNQIVTGPITISGSAWSAGSSEYLLEVRIGKGEWLPVATGSADRIRTELAVWDSSPYDGNAELRLQVDGEIEFRRFIRVTNHPIVAITAPADSALVFASVDIRGSVAAPDFQDWRLIYAPESNPKQETLIHFDTKLQFDARLTEWTVGQLPPGNGFLRLIMTTASGEYAATTRVTLKSALATGYPYTPPERPHLTSVVGNLDDDPAPEIITGTRRGLIINHFDIGVSEFVTAEGGSYQSAPAVFDFDGDGRDEIVAVSDSGVTIMTPRGEPLPGWPKSVNTGLQFNSYPTPLLSDIDGDGSPEVLFVNSTGEIYCWRAGGESYFRSTAGLFATCDLTNRYRVFGGTAVAYLFAYDFNHDGYQDVGALYTRLAGDGGIYLYSGKNGAPLFPDIGERLFRSDVIYGGVLADFDGDGEPEIAFAHWYGTQLSMAVRIIEADGSDLPGWPKLFDDKVQWLTSYPAAADLDNDSLPELICAFSALDGGEVFVWRGDGTSFVGNEFGRNDGFLAATSNSLSNPLVFDVDNDGELEIVSRGGSLFLGKPERFFAWKLDGSIAAGWPLYSYADPGFVTYAPQTPVVGDFDLDGLLEMYCGASDSKLYAWNLPTLATDDAVVWGTFLGNNRNTGLLPIVARPSAEPPPLPQSFRLAQNYPNPFNQNTVIEIELPQSEHITLEILNLLGQCVITLADRRLAAGSHALIWDGRDSSGRNVASGVYFYRFKMGHTTETRRMVLLR